MKRKLFLIGTLALIVAGGIFWSCQKENIATNPENGLNLKSAENCNVCVTNWIDSKETITIGTNVFVDIWNDDVNAYFKVYRLSGATIGNIQFDNGSNIGFTPAVTEYLITKPIAQVVACTKVSTFFNKIGGLGGAGGTITNLTIDYYLRELCVVDCEESFSYTDNGDNTYTFTYIPAEDLTDAVLVFTFPQDILDEGLDNWTKNGQTLQTTMDLEACETYEWTVKLTCKDLNNPQNKWSDFKVNNYSKKGTLDNIKCD